MGLASLKQSDSSLTLRMTLMKHRLALYINAQNDKNQTLKLVMLTLAEASDSHMRKPIPSFRPSESERRNPMVLGAYTGGFLDYARDDKIVSF